MATTSHFDRKCLFLDSFPWIGQKVRKQLESEFPSFGGKISFFDWQQIRDVVSDGVREHDVPLFQSRPADR
jgi:hypothetical protein